MRRIPRKSWRHGYCGAWAQSRGRPCRAKGLPPNGRCRFHGNGSTGPKTEAGKRKVVAAVVASLARWRAEMGLPPWWRYVQSRRTGGRLSAAAYIAKYGPWDGRPREEFEARPDGARQQP